MIYLPQHETVTVDLSKISGNKKMHGGMMLEQERQLK